MTRILVLVPFPLSDEQLALRVAQSEAVKLAPDVTLHYRPVRAAPDRYVSQADYALADLSMLDAGQSAQADGFDAVCIDTMSDSGVAALRSLLDIPVVGPGRLSMLTAMMLGSRFSVVTMWDAWKPLYAKTITELGISHAVASVRALDINPDNRTPLSGKENEIFPLLETCATACIEEDGAEVILLGSTTMHQAHGYLAQRLPVPVVNPGPLTYKMVEALLGLGLSHSRKAYPAPMTAKDDLVRAMFDAGERFEAGKP